MDTASQSGPGTKPAKGLRTTRIFGVGNAGVNVLEPLIAGGLAQASFIAIHSDPIPCGILAAVEQLQLESRLGADGDPERMRAWAEEQAPRLKALCAGAEVVLLIAGLGGAAGTGISPVLARLAKESGALVLGFVIVPFDCEGGRRQRFARLGLEHLMEAADGVVCLPNQKVLKLTDETTSVPDTFKLGNELLAEGVRGIWRLLAYPGLIEIHIGDLCALLRDRHAESAFAAVEAMGAARSREVVEKLLAHPLLEGGQVLAESNVVLVSLMGGPDLAMAEVNRVMEQLHSHCQRAQLIMGAAVDETFRERLAVIVIAAQRTHGSGAEKADGEGAEGLDSQLLGRSAPARPESRFLPPPPSLSPEKMEQMLARQGSRAGRPRKALPKLRQTQLPLEIVSKGRFDKSEPTIHKGEDLDVPTYIRRGVSLN